MRKALQILLGIILGIIPCIANATSVSITAITDTDGSTWTNGTIDWQLYNPSHTQLPVICKTGQPVNASFTWSFTSGVTSGIIPGNDTICPANTRWQATVNPNATSGSVTTKLMTISGASQDVTTFFTGLPAPRFSAAKTYGYSDFEANTPFPGDIFFNVTNQTYVTWSGSAWIPLTSTGTVTAIATTENETNTNMYFSLLGSHLTGTQALQVSGNFVVNPGYTGVGTQPGLFQSSIINVGSYLHLIGSNNTFIYADEHTGPFWPGAAGIDILWSDSVNHHWEMALNGGSNFYVPGVPSTKFTAGHCLESAANGIDLTDAGQPCNNALPAIPTVVDTSSPVTVSAINNQENHFNENSTATAPVTYNLPTASAGKQFCFTNANNGSQANTGVLSLKTSAAGQYIIQSDGTLSQSGGQVSSGGGYADSACLTGVDATHWMLNTRQGSWISPVSGPFDYVTSVQGTAQTQSFSFSAAANTIYVVSCTNTESSNGPSIIIDSPTPSGQGQVLDNEVALRWLYYTSGQSVAAHCVGGAIGTNKVSVFSCPACLVQAPLTTGHTSSSGTITTLTVSALTTSARSYTLACEGDTNGNEPLTSATIDSLSGTLFPAQIQNANCAWVQATTSYTGASAQVNWTPIVSQAGEVVFAMQY